MKVLLVTNDFPPRVGGIQVYLWNIYRRLAEQGVEVRVLAPSHPGDAAFDATAGMEVVRSSGRVMWPTPALRRRVHELSRDVDAIAFGAVLPMNLIATRLDRPVVAHTHGFEVAWARLPVLTQALRRIGRAASVVTVVSEYTRAFIERALGPDIRTHLLRTGVDLERFHPGVDGDEIKKRSGLDGRPVIACVSRLVPRKGQDRLIEAMPQIRRVVPDAAVLIVGGGPYRARLERMAAERELGDAVVFAGEIPEADLASAYAAGDVFAMPCRSRYSELEVEGLGLVYLEAQACGRPAITGDSGGAPEAVIPGRTGLVVPGSDVAALVEACARMLADTDAATRMGAEGRAFVEREHRWDDVVARFRAMLNEAT